MVSPAVNWSRAPKLLPDRTAAPRRGPVIRGPAVWAPAVNLRGADTPVAAEQRAGPSSLVGSAGVAYGEDDDDGPRGHDGARRRGARR